MWHRKVTLSLFFFLKGLKFKMATLIRPELSTKNKYYIDKHRYYELKHFCLQYPEWKKAYCEFDDYSVPLSMIERISTDNMPGDPTAKRALLKILLLRTNQTNRKNSNRNRSILVQLYY